MMIFILVLAACGNEEAVEDEMETDDLAVLEVEFNLPETAEPGETVELEAVVTYGGEPMEVADRVLFEYWLEGQEHESEEIEGTHTGNGSYTAEVTFSEEGVYELFAHTDAEGQHTMPLESIEIGEIE